MKPKIKTRLTNLMARLAGSDNYDPKVKPITPLEFYFEQYIMSSLPTISIPIAFLQDAEDPELHTLNISDAAFERYISTGLIKYRFDNYDAPNKARTSTCQLIKDTKTALIVNYIELLKPDSPDAEFVAYHFSIIKHQNGVYHIIGVFNEV